MQQGDKFIAKNNVKYTCKIHAIRTLHCVTKINAVSGNIMSYTYQVIDIKVTQLDTSQLYHSRCKIPVNIVHRDKIWLLHGFKLARNLNGEFHCS